jgi:hypothetical protein
VLYAFEIGPDEKETFLEYLRQGLRPNQAAKEAGSTGTQFRRLRRPGGEHFDAEFADAWNTIIASGDHRRELEDRVRDMVWDSAEDGNWAARWKLALTYLPEFEWAKSASLNVNMQMQVLTQALPALTMEELERVQAALADGVKPELKALPEVIDAVA